MKARTITAVDYQALEKHVRKLERVSPAKADAVVKMVAYYLKDERSQSKVQRERTERRQIDRRLMAAHECPKVYVGFTQLPPSGDTRAWKCLGCGKTVTL